MSANATESLGERGQLKLAALCHALRMSPELGRAAPVFDIMASTWSGRSSAVAPLFASDITDDHSPFEFSIAFNAEAPELRVLTEALGVQPSLESNWNAAWQVNEQLERTFGVSLERPRRIADLFFPTDPRARFSLWHAACFRAASPPGFKVYFNPQASKSHQSELVVREALDRLGMRGAWSWLAAHARLDRGRLVYFALDLADDAAARVKVYVAYDDATAGEVENIAKAPYFERGEFRQFCRALVGNEGPFSARPPIACMAFVALDATRPSSLTLHVPLRCYVQDDLAALRGVGTLLSRRNAVLYQRALGNLADRPLQEGVGLQTYASILKAREQRRLTLYLSPELYGFAPARPVKATPPGPQP